MPKSTDTKGDSRFSVILYTPRAKKFIPFSAPSKFLNTSCKRYAPCSCLAIG